MLMCRPALCINSDFCWAYLQQSLPSSALRQLQTHCLAKTIFILASGTAIPCVASGYFNLLSQGNGSIAIWHGIGCRSVALFKNTGGKKLCQEEHGHQTKNAYPFLLATLHATSLQSLCNMPFSHFSNTLRGFGGQFFGFFTFPDCFRAKQSILSTLRIWRDKRLMSFLHWLQVSRADNCSYKQNLCTAKTFEFFRTLSGWMSSTKKGGKWRK